MNLLWVFLVFIIIYSVMGLDLQNTQTGETFHYLSLIHIFFVLRPNVMLVLR